MAEMRFSFYCYVCYVACLLVFIPLCNSEDRFFYDELLKARNSLTPSALSILSGPQYTVHFNTHRYLKDVETDHLKGWNLYTKTGNRFFCSVDPTIEQSPPRQSRSDSVNDLWRTLLRTTFRINNLSDPQAILSPLKHISLEHNAGWWNYDVHLFQGVRQFRDESDHVGTVFINSMNEFGLGVFDAYRTKELQNLVVEQCKRNKSERIYHQLVRKATASSRLMPRNPISFQSDTIFPVQLYSSGSLCEFTRIPRESEIRFQCHQNNATHLTTSSTVEQVVDELLSNTFVESVSEPSSCYYRVIVKTPLACALQSSQQQQQQQQQSQRSEKPPVTAIQCTAVVDNKTIQNQAKLSLYLSARDDIIRQISLVYSHHRIPSMDPHTEIGFLTPEYWHAHRQPPHRPLLFNISETHRRFVSIKSAHTPKNVYQMSLYLKSQGIPYHMVTEESESAKKNAKLMQHMMDMVKKKDVKEMLGNDVVFLNELLEGKLDHLSMDWVTILPEALQELIIADLSQDMENAPSVDRKGNKIHRVAVNESIHASSPSEDSVNQSVVDMRKKKKKLEYVQ